MINNSYQYLSVIAKGHFFCGDHWIKERQITATGCAMSPNVGIHYTSELVQELGYTRIGMIGQKILEHKLQLLHC